MTVNLLGKPQGCTNYKIRQLMRQMSRHYDAEIGKAGLKATQFSLLGHVQQLGPVRPGELAQVLRMDASTLTRNLKPLVEAGWLRIEAGADGRSRSVTITEAGRTKRAEAQQYWKIAQERINSTLGVERVLALHALIDESLDLLAAQDSKGE